MALQPFAKAADLQALVPGIDDATASLALALVSSAIRAAVGWDVDRVVGKVHTRVIPFRRRGTGTDVWSVILPALNVTGVSSVKVDGRTLTSSEYDVTSSGIVYLHHPAYQMVEVTYTAGWARTPTDAAPPIFREVALEYAAKLAENPSAVQSYRLGQASETFGGTLEDALRDDWRLDGYRVEGL